MARSIATIKQQIIDAKNADLDLADLTSTSQTATWNLWAYVTAVLINLHEQIWDILKGELEGKIRVAGVGTLPWLREQILLFQFGDGEHVELDTVNMVFKYAVFDDTKQIITRCSIKQDGNRVVTAKVAKGDTTPIPLTLDEQNALTAYLNEIKFAGTQINVFSKNSDKIRIEAAIKYRGEFASVIKDNVKTALQNYCKNLSSADNFDGTVRVNDVIDAIQGVEGVTDILLAKLSLLPDGTSVPNIIYQLSLGINLGEYQTFSGYIEESPSPDGFLDTLTFNAV